MKYRSTIALFILAVAVGWLALADTTSKYHHAIFGSEVTQPGELLLKTKLIDKTRQITLTNGEGDSIQFFADGPHWTSTKPWKDRVDHNFVKYLFQFATHLKVEETIPRDEVDPADFGLRKTTVRMIMRDKKGKKIYDFRIGRMAAWHVPTNDPNKTIPTIFIRFKDHYLKDTIYLCSSPAAQGIHKLFKNKFARFRDHHPFLFSPKQLDKVTIQNPEGELILARKNSHAPWTITKPLELRVDYKALSTLFNDLYNLTALKVEDRTNVTLPTAESDTAAGRKISLHFAGAKEDTTLHIYPPIQEDSPTVLATVSDRPNTVFHFPLTNTSDPKVITTPSQLQASVNDLRSKTITHLNGKLLKTIIIRPTGRADILLQRTPTSQWRVLRKNGWNPANQEAIIQLITALTRDKIVKFVTDAAADLSPYGLNRPFLRIGLVSFRNRGMGIAFGRDPKNPSSEKIYAHIIGKPNIWEISSETLGKIATYPWQWRTHHVWHIPKVDINTITITHQNQPPIQLTYHFFSEDWTAHQGDKDLTASLNPNRANNFLKTLTSLHCAKWLSPNHPQATQFIKNPATTIKIHLNREDSYGNPLPPMVKSLKIAHTPNKLIHFGKINSTPKDPHADGEQNYFLLSPETISKLSTNLFE